MNIASPVVFEDEFLNTLHGYQNGKACENMLGKSYLASTRIKRINHQACYNKGIGEGHIDDISQETFMLFLGKYAQKIDPIDRAYSVISSIAYNLASNKRQKSSEASIDDMAQRFSDNDEDAYAATAYLFPDSAVNQIEQLEEAIDTMAASAEFGRRMQIMNAQEHLNQDQVLPTVLRLSMVMRPEAEELVVACHDAGDASPPISTKWAEVKMVLKAENRRSPAGAKRETTDDGARLNEIRKEMGFDNKLFASVLEITSSALVSYLYGTVHSVPIQVMKRAERLLKNFSIESYRSAVNPKIILPDDDIAKIIDSWIQALGLDVKDPEVNNVIASMLGVSRPTVWRWRTKDMRPRLKVLQAYDKAIAAVVRVKKKSK